VGLGFSEQGITLDAGPLTIADDTAFTSQPFIKVDRIRISLDPRALFLRREIHITNILLQSPQIHFIRSQEGSINARSFGQKSQKNPVILSPILVILSETKDLKKINSSRDSSPRFLLSQESIGAQNDVKIQIQDASISFIDQNQTFPKDIWLTDTGASLNDFSLDLSKRSVRIGDLRLHADLSQLDIKDISPEMPNSPIFKNIRGQVELNLADLEIGATGDLEAKGDINITGAVIKNFNIFKTVLSPVLGVFGGMDGYVDKLGAKDTIIDKAMAQFSIHNNAVFIDNFLIKTNIFELTAKGSVDQGLHMDLQTILYLNADVSAVLVSELEGLKYLMDDSKRIAMDASLKGVIPHLKFKPNKDFRKKSKKALIEEGGNFLKNFLR